MKTLYLCYLGLREPLVQTQVLPYLRHIRREGIRVSLLTFEPNRRRSWSAQEIERWRQRLDAEGIEWHMRPYHKRPSAPATLYDIVIGAWTVWRLARRFRIEVLHARSHVPMAMALLVRPFVRCRLVFDMRGFLADEYAAAGRWSERSGIFRMTKWLEEQGVRRADQIVVLTERARQWLLDQGWANADRITVIPCCVDAARFSNGTSAADSGTHDPFEVIYAGSVTGLYRLEEMARFFLALRVHRPHAVLRILTQGPVDYARQVLERVLPQESFWVGCVPPDRIGASLQRARLGLSFRTPSFAQIGASPTKIAEYLLAGLPVVANEGVGDMDGLLTQAKVGVVMRTLDGRYDEAARQALQLSDEPGIRERCRRAALAHFDLDRVGGPAYRWLYRRLSRDARRRRLLVLTPYPSDCAPSQRMKFEKYYPSFEAHGIEVTVSPFMCRALWRVLYERGRLFTKVVLTLFGYLRRLRDLVRAGRFDAVYLHQWAVPFGPPWLETSLTRRKIPIVYDIDDLIYLPRASQANAFLKRFRRERRITRLMRLAHHVVVGTEYVRQFALRHNAAVTCIPASIDTDVYYPKRHSSETGSVTIGWSGSYSTAPYLQLIAPILQRLAQRFAIRLLVVGEPRFRLEGVRVDARPWRLEREVADLAEMDIGLYPLSEDEWVLGKSGGKGLQYMGMGIPVVASAVGAARDFVVDGENGFLAQTPETWEARLAALIQDPALRARMGAAGRRTVEQRYSMQANAPVYLRVLESVLGGKDAAQRRGRDVTTTPRSSAAVEAYAGLPRR